MNRNGQGPENKGAGTGWGRGGCFSEEELKSRESSWNGRNPQGRGLGRGAGFGGRGCGMGFGGRGMGRGAGRGFGRGYGFGAGPAVSGTAENAILDRLSALEASIKELKQ